MILVKRSRIQNLAIKFLFRNSFEKTHSEFENGFTDCLERQKLDSSIWFQHSSNFFLPIQCHHISKQFMIFYLSKYFSLSDNVSSYNTDHWTTDWRNSDAKVVYQLWSDQKQLRQHFHPWQDFFFKSWNKRGCRQKSIPKGDVRAI